MHAVDTLIYEYPTNDCIRACLKLEPLLQQVQHFNTDCSKQHRQILLMHTDILNILDRPDLKAKLIQLIQQKHLDLTQLMSHQAVHQTRLMEYLKQLEQLTEQLSQKDSLCCLQDHPLIRAIRAHHSHPGGLSNFALPQLHQWLHQPTQDRQIDLEQMRQETALIHTVLNTVLTLIRNTRPFSQAEAQQGFFQTILDPSIPIHLIRIQTTLNTYPAISVGKHRLSIHFLSPETTPARPIESNLSFQWTYTY